MTFTFRLLNLPLWCDNIWAIYLSNISLFDARTKHIEIDFYSVYDQVIQDQLLAEFVSTKD
jgi:hypothetical protein